MAGEQNVKIISAYAGGLGDTLCFSTLPEMYARRGYKVLIGPPAVEPSIRNAEIRKLVWELNPYVSGFTDDRGITFTHLDMHKWIWAQNSTKTLVEAMEALHGFEPTHTFPRIYYQPRWRPELSDTILADPTSISQHMRPEVFDAFVDHICRARSYDRKHILVLTSRFSGIQGQQALSGNQRHEVHDIFEYADLIASCRLFITSESGGAILASALRASEATPEIFSLFTSQGFNDRVFQFPNVRHCVTGQLTDDYYVHPSNPIAIST
jgi:hypothetical protein